MISLFAPYGEKFAVFNIADSLLVCGAALMMWHAFRTERRTATAASPVDAPASTPSATSS